jgi:RNA polymerase sigma factor (sigma-70 family)
VTLPPFEEVVRTHGPTVLRVCRALLGPVEADDAWSETFLAALRAYPDLRPDSNVEAWLVTIAHRKAIDQHRARARAPLPVLELPEAATAETTVDNDLWEAVKALPFTQRAAVAYHHLVGLPYAQIADILGHSEAAARRAAADGIKTLRARLTRTVEGVTR